MNDPQEQKHHHHHPDQAADVPLEKLVEEKAELEELLEEIDLEIWAKEGREPRKAKRYRIKVDATYYTVHQHEMTGAGILTVAGKIPPDAFILNMKIRGHGVKTIALDEKVDFSSHRVERFSTIPKQVQEGAAG